MTITSRLAMPAKAGPFDGLDSVKAALNRHAEIVAASTIEFKADELLWIAAQERHSRAVKAAERLVKIARLQAEVDALTVRARAEIPMLSEVVPLAVEDAPRPVVTIGE